ncbi:MAG TPA: ABC transporter ATP-binding protein, partial [Herpetosiphonaceae bacterium]|nr:ABC transporter ATP-binding protein [Herpetosiphonaceae bacterium]
YREDWRVGIALTLFAGVAFIALRGTRMIAVPSTTAAREASAMLFGFLEERLAGIDDIRANGGGSYAVRRFHVVMRTLFQQMRRSEMIGMVIWTTLAVLFTLGYALALGSGAFLFGRGTLTIGTVYLIFQYTEMLRRPLEQITDQLKDFQKAAASVGRVQELYSQRSTLEDGAGVPLPDHALPVEIDQVSFTYEDGEPVLQEITIGLEPGKSLGLLGRTGSGKTTLTRLLLRLYDPSAGAIRLGGVDIRDARMAELRHRIGVVTQDVQLFQASVRDNLTLFDDEISDERVMAVLEELGLGDWIRSMPEGLQTELSPGGAGLSAGEGQLLAFTRVFLRNPGLVILDEASSRLDPATEELIERAVDKLLRNRTAIIIAHRLHTVQRTDDIVILEQGRIREYGARDQLARDPDSRFYELLQTGMEEVLV